MGSDGTALGAGASQVAAEKVILQLKSEKDPVGSRFGILQVGSSKQGNTNIMLTWKKAKGAKKYAVYGIICGKNKMQKLATVSKNKYNVKKAGKKLAKGNYYKFMVVALDQNNNVVSTSKITHIATVNAKGVVKGVKKGKTKVFVYAQNGACKINTVKVK